MEHDTTGGVVYNVPPVVNRVVVLGYVYSYHQTEWWTPGVRYPTYRVINTVAPGVQYSAVIR